MDYSVICGNRIHFGPRWFFSTSKVNPLLALVGQMRYPPAGVKESPSPRRAEDRLLVRLLQAVDLIFARLYHHLTVRSPCRLPRKGAAILVCNHTSALDPALIQAPCSRLIVWMMAAEYYDLPVLRWVFRTVQAIPTLRSGRDLAAVRGALRTLKEGGILGIFPEGRIEPSDELLPLETGAVLMALRANVPIYPAYLDGTQRNRSMIESYLKPCRATIWFGPPVEFDRTDTSKEALEAATAKIQQAISALRAQHLTSSVSAPKSRNLSP